ncbi:multidrug ABC transporter permease [Streptococcus suis]|nr:multidrug ABC transporter permease [Streptococcus suis]NQH95657.1 multidrug ABC transporter permease [Streptococcus suis]
MKALFGQRKNLFLRQCATYLRYVLNDHFVLVVLVLFGFLALQYRQLLENLPSQSWLLYVILALVSLLLFLAGNVATYVEEADKIFLLSKEAEMPEIFFAANRRAFLVWASLQLVGQLILLPLYLKLKLPILLFIPLIFMLTIAKYFYFRWKLLAFMEEERVDWVLALQYESKRKSSILKFFSLFTNVKGLTSFVKRRSYLDGLLGHIKKETGFTWDYLFMRAFLRSGDYISLALRLVILSIVFFVTVRESWLSVGLASLFHYLLLFQLLPLYHAYDYQLMAELLPVGPDKRLISFKRVLRQILYLSLILQSVLGLLLLEEKQYLLVFIGIGILLNHFYLDSKAKKLID